MYSHLCSARTREPGGQISSQGLGMKAGKGLNPGNLGRQDNGTHPPKHREEPNPEAGIVGTKVSFKFSPRRRVVLRTAGVSRAGGMV